MKILIDNGHGYNTAGKRSPDGRLREYKYTREIAAEVVNGLKALGYDATLLTPEAYDVSLNARVKRVNDICRKSGIANVLVVSIHNNAAGSKGQWLTARGWSAHVGLNASQRSKRLASCLAKAAEAQGIKVRRQRPGQDHWPQNLAICRDTLCAAVLTENLFQDNREDVEFLLSDAGRKAVAQLHINGIISYIKS